MSLMKLVAYLGAICSVTSSQIFRGSNTTNGSNASLISSHIEDTLYRMLALPSSSRTVHATIHGSNATLLSSSRAVRGTHATRGSNATDEAGKTSKKEKEGKKEKDGQEKDDETKEQEQDKEDDKKEKELKEKNRKKEKEQKEEDEKEEKELKEKDNEKDKDANADKEFDCNAGLKNADRGWSEGKKDWCCENEGLCEKQAKFDCNAGLAKADKGWSELKKQWCCKHEEKACEAKVVKNETDELDCSKWPCDGNYQRYNQKVVGGKYDDAMKKEIYYSDEDNIAHHKDYLKDVPASTPKPRSGGISAMRLDTTIVLILLGFATRRMDIVSVTF